MLEHYFRRRKKFAEIKTNPLAPFLEEAAAHYRAKGYADKYAQAALRYAASFGDWLRSHRVPLARVTESHVDAFLKWLVPTSPQSSKRK